MAVVSSRRRRRDVGVTGFDGGLVADFLHGQGAVPRQQGDQRTVAVSAAVLHHRERQGKPCRQSREQDLQTLQSALRRSYGSEFEH